MDDTGRGLPNSEVEADVALAALGTTQLNSSRWADLETALAVERRASLYEASQQCPAPLAL